MLLLAMVPLTLIIGFIWIVKMIIPKNLAASGGLDGFKNYLASTFSVNVPTQSLAAGRFISFTASTALNNANSISQVQVQYSGLSSNYYIMNGLVNTFWNSGDFEVESYYYFDGTNLNVFTVIVNQMAGSITIPNIAINCRGFLFIAPF